MKHLLLFTHLLLINLCSCQAQLPENDGFADVNFSKTDSNTGAKYYRKHEHIDSPGALNVNPNYSDFSMQNDGYGMLFNTPTNDFELHKITFYDFSNKKVMEAEALTSEMLNDYILDGPAVWYDSQGHKIKEGTFYYNNLAGEVRHFNVKGELISTEILLNGKVFHATTSEKLLGRWVCEDPQIFNDYLGEVDDNLMLYNEIYSNGSIEIWTDVKKVGEFSTSVPDKTRLYITFNKESESRGILKVYSLMGNVISTERLTFIGDNNFKSEQLDGEKAGYLYEFKRTEDKPEDNKTDSKLIGLWRCDTPRIYNDYLGEIDSNLMLFNQFFSDATIEIWTDLREVTYDFADVEPEKTKLNIHFEMISEYEGILKVYDNRERLISKEKITFITDEELIDEILYTLSGESIGETYRFKKVNSK